MTMKYVSSSGPYCSSLDSGNAIVVVVVAAVSAGLV